MKNFNYSQNLLNIAFSLLVCIFTTFILSALGFILHLSINILYPIIALTVACGTLFYILKKSNTTKIEFICSFLFFLFVMLTAYIVAICKYDPSCDGRAYHQLGIMLLGNGYNPIYDSIYTFSQKFFNQTVDNLIWVETYPKFMEITSSNVFILTKQIEAGKMLNYLLMFIAFGYSFYILNKDRFSNIKLPFKMLISLALVFNPVVIAQMFTYYIDFAVYFFFVFMVLSIIDLEIEQNNRALFIYFMSSICLLNVKWGGFLFYIVTTLIYLLYLLINTEKKNALKFCLINIFVVIFTCLTLINPIYTNIKNHNHPLYPIAGKEKIDLMTPNTPKEFLGHNRFRNILYSTFCEVNNIYSAVNQDIKVKLKIPFSIHKSEFVYLSDWDTRECGFGVLWSGIIFLTLVLPFFIKFNNKKDKKIFILLFTLLILLTVLNPYSWWTRYAPHIWLFPILISVFVLNKKNRNKFELIYVCLIYSLIAANLILQTIYASKTERHFRKNTKMFISNLFRNSSNTNIQIYGTFDMSIIQKLKEGNIKYKFVDEKYYSKNKNKFTIIPYSLGNKMYYSQENK